MYNFYKEGSLHFIVWFLFYDTLFSLIFFLVAKAKCIYYRKNREYIVSLVNPRLPHGPVATQKSTKEAWWASISASDDAVLILFIYCSPFPPDAPPTSSLLLCPLRGWSWTLWHPRFLLSGWSTQWMHEQPHISRYFPEERQYLI